jgi:hypothetical protein
MTTRGSRREDPAADVPAEIPAQSLDGERAVLGAIMSPDADGAATLQGLRERGVTETTFYPETYRTVFRHLCALADAGRPLTLATVLTSLREAGGHGGDRKCRDDTQEIAMGTIVNLARLPANGLPGEIEEDGGGRASEHRNVVLVGGSPSGLLRPRPLSLNAPLRPADDRLYIHGAWEYPTVRQRPRHHGAAGRRSSRGTWSL